MNDLTVVESSPKKLPRSEAAIEEAAARSRKMVTRRALTGAGLSVIPIPGVNATVDIALMASILDSVNKEFGLSPQQIELLSTDNQLKVFGIITASGSAWAGKLITKNLVIAVLKKMSLQLTAAQIGKLVPLVGSAASAGLSFAAIKWVGNQHIKDCINIARKFNELGQRY